MLGHYSFGEDLRSCRLDRIRVSETLMPPALHLQAIRDARVRRGQQALEMTSMPIAEIAVTTGFCDQAHFTRVFRAATGVTPGQYRRRHS